MKRTRCTFTPTLEEASLMAKQQQYPTQSSPRGRKGRGWMPTVQSKPVQTMLLPPGSVSQLSAAPKVSGATRPHGQGKSTSVLPCQEATAQGCGVGRAPSEYRAGDVSRPLLLTSNPRCPWPVRHHPPACAVSLCMSVPTPPTSTWSYWTRPLPLQYKSQPNQVRF